MNTKSQRIVEISTVRVADSGSAGPVSTSKIYVWQYNGSALFDEIVQWCRDTFGYVDWYWRNETVYFENEKDYTMFLLRWS